MFHEDFFNCLQELGRLPLPSTQDYIQEIKKVEELKKKYEDIMSKPGNKLLRDEKIKVAKVQAKNDDLIRILKEHGLEKLAETETANSPS